MPANSYSTKPSRKLSRRMVAKILGILILIVGLVAGIILVGQRQLFSQKAAGIPPICPAGLNCVEPRGILNNRCPSGYSFTCISFEKRGPRKLCCEPGGPVATPTPKCTTGSCYDKCVCRGNTPSECRAACSTPTPRGECDGCTYYDCSQQLVYELRNGQCVRNLKPGFCSTNYPGSDPCKRGKG